MCFASAERKRRLPLEHLPVAPDSSTARKYLAMNAKVNTYIDTRTEWLHARRPNQSVLYRPPPAIKCVGFS